MTKEIIHFINAHFILSLLWISIFTSIIILTIKEYKSKIKIITRNKAIQLINNEKGIIIDLRTKKNFLNGHIINSINLSSLKIKKKDIIKLKKHKNQPIILTSENSLEIFNEAEKLIQKNFKFVFILKEGIIGWSNENLPLIKKQ